MKRILSLLVTSAAFALCSCQSTMQSDISAGGSSCCSKDCCKAAAAKKTACATCATGAKHKH